MRERPPEQQLRRPFADRRKHRPIPSTNSGTHFPVEARCGNRIPQSGKIPSHSFPDKPQSETATQNPPPNRDTRSGRTNAKLHSHLGPKVINPRNACTFGNGTHPFRFSAPARSQAAVHPRFPEYHVTAGSLQDKALKTIRRTEEAPAARSAQRGLLACPRTFSELYPVGSRGDTSATQPSEPGRR